MIKDKTYGMYIEYSDIPDKDLKEEFDVSIESLLTSTLLEKDADGWYYPKNIIQHKQENIIAFLCLLTNKPALKKFHKYIDNLLFKQGNLIINYRDEAIEDELW